MFICVISFYPVIGSAYIGEVSPLVLRGVTESMVNLGFVVGQLIASGNLLKGTNNLESKWTYKIPDAAQWAPAVFVLAFVCFCPNSPWWLSRKGKYADAKRLFVKLSIKRKLKFNGPTSAAIY